MGDMDSGNSGSIQSSSTGGAGGRDDQEYDSSHGGATDSISAFFNGYNHNIHMGISNNNNTTTSTAQLYSFNSSSSYPSQTLPQLGVPNYFSSLESPNFINNGINNNNNSNNNNINNNRNNQLDIVWPNKFPSVSTNDTNCTEGHPVSYNITNNPQQNIPTTLPLPAHGPPAPSLSSSPRAGPSGRNPKKRTRASRRAPTTVLTTDTTNFRQMVQEFTGIPSPPFTSFSPRTRFDLFTGLTGHSSNNINSSVIVQPPLLSSLLRPFPQKIAPLHPPQFFNNNDHNNTNTTNTNNNTSIMGDTVIGLSPTNFQLCDPPHQDYINNTSNNNNSQLNFQSFLQSSSLPPLEQQDSSMSMGCTNVSNSNTAQISCSVNPASGSYLGISTNNSTSINGGLDSIGVVVTKGSEGMVDSWICSSD